MAADTLRWPVLGLVKAEGADVGPWANGITVDEMSTVVAASEGARKTLLWLGYNVTGLYYRHPSSGAEWAYVALDTHVAEGYAAHDGDTSGPLVSTAEPGPLLVLEVEQLIDARDGTTSMGIYDDGFFLPPSLGVWYYERNFFGIEGADAPFDASDSEAAKRLKRLEPSLNTFVTDGVNALVERWVAGNIAPETRCGLLWLPDPFWWRPELETGEREPSSAGRLFESIGREAWLGVSEYGDGGPNEGAMRAFLTDQLGSEPGETLADILNGIYWMPWRGNQQSDRFFTQLQTWAAETSGSLLPDWLLERLGDLPWLEVITSLVNQGIFQVTALGGSALAAEEPEEAVEAMFLEDGHSVELTVYKQVTITLSRRRNQEGLEVDTLTPEELDAVLAEPLEQYFSWEWVVVEDEEPTLIIVAAPGVEISIPVEPDGWTHDIFRVQSHSLVPSWGETIREEVLLAAYTIPFEPVLTPDLVLFEELPQDETDETTPEEDTEPKATSKIPGLLVVPTRNGVTLQYPVYEDGSGDALLKINLTCTDDRSANDRFVFDIAFFKQPDRIRPPGSWDSIAHVSVWMTDGFTAAVTQYWAAESSLLTDTVRHALWKTDDYLKVPPTGTILPFEIDDDDEMYDAWPIVDESPAASGMELVTGVVTIELDDWMYDAIDITSGIGLALFCPAVGDILDAAEFGYALYYGVDKWGRPVTSLELAIMGAGVMLPIVTKGVLLGAARPLTSGLALEKGVSSLILRYVPSGVLDAKGVDDLLEWAADWHKATPAARQTIRKSVEDSLILAAQQYGTSIRRTYLTFGDLVNTSGTGFALPALDNAFRRWVIRTGVVNPAQLSNPAVFAEFGERWAREGVGQSRVVFEALLGNSFVGGKKIRRSPAASRLWKSSRPIAFKKNPPSRSVLLTKLSDAVDAAEAHVAARTGDDLTYGDPVWVLKSFLQHGDVERAPASVYRTRIEALLTKLGASNTPPGMNLASLQKLLGPNKLVHPEELGRLLVLAMDLAETEAKSMGRTLDEVLELEGIDGFFYHAIVAKGYEHGSRFEVQLAAKELANRATKTTLRIGHPLPGVVSPVLREGPDLVRYSTNGGSLIQGKAYKSVDALVMGSTHGGGPPEILRQLFSDIIRMSPSFQLVARPGRQGMEKFSGKVTFAIDFQYMFQNQVPPRELDDLWAEAMAKSEVLQKDLNDYLATPAARAALGLPSGLNIKLTIDLVQKPVLVP